MVGLSNYIIIITKSKKQWHNKKNDWTLYHKHREWYNYKSVSVIKKHNMLSIMYKC